MLERIILEKAWQIIENADHWTQSAAARDRQGEKTAPECPAACRWCAIGAVEKVVAELGASDAQLFEIVDHLCKSTKALFGMRSINFVNDHRDHDAIRRIFEHAIANCRLVEAAGVDEEPAETERLRAAVNACLGYISQLEDGLQKSGALVSQSNPVINHIKHNMGMNGLGLAPLSPPSQAAN